MKDNVNAIRVEFGNAGFTVYDINIEKRNHDTLIWHSHKYYEVHFAVCGTHSYEVGDKSVTLREGEMLIISPDVEHTAVAGLRDDDYCYWVLEFTLEKMDQKTTPFYSKFANALRGSSLRAMPIGEELYEKMSRYKNVDSSRYCRLKVETYAVINALMEAICDDEVMIGASLRFDEDVDQTLIVIDNLINQGATVKEIARETNYSERHVARLIKSKYGDTLTGIQKRRGERK